MGLVITVWVGFQFIIYLWFLNNLHIEDKIHSKFAFWMWLIPFPINLIFMTSRFTVLLIVAIILETIKKYKKLD